MKRTRREPAVYVEIIDGALVPVDVPVPGPPYTITYAVGDFTFGFSPAPRPPLEGLGYYWWPPSDPPC